jgi:hypothetical protein
MVSYHFLTWKKIGQNLKAPTIICVSVAKIVIQKCVNLDEMHICEPASVI